MQTIKLKPSLLIIMLLCQSFTFARDIPLTWDALIEESDAVITGQVIEAKFMARESNVSSNDFPITIKVKISTHDLIKDRKTEPPNEVMIHYKSFYNPVNVGLEGTFFIQFQNNRYLVSDSEYGSWPITYIRTPVDDAESQNSQNSKMIPTYDMSQINIYQLPDTLQETVTVLTYELNEGQVKQSIQAVSHFTPKALKKFLSITTH